MTLDLDKLEALYAVATPGEWFIEVDGENDTIVLVSGTTEIAEFPFYAPFRHKPNESFVAALHNAFPALAAAVRERDAYRKAKAENDERFMLERDEARRERDAALAELASVRRSVEAARVAVEERDELVKQLREAADTLDSLVDPDPCWFDHHGGCQAHGFLDLQPGEECPNAAAQRIIAALTPKES